MLSLFSEYNVKLRQSEQYKILRLKQYIINTISQKNNNHELKAQKMEKENLQELSTKELTKKKLSLNFAFGLLIGSLVMSTIITIVESLQNGFQIFTIIPFALSPILAILYKSVAKINKELKSRNANG